MNLSMVMDLYELSMANGFQQSLAGDEGVFDVFYRKVPDDGDFVISAGLESVITAVRDFHFDADDIQYIKNLNLFTPSFIDMLANFKFTGDISAIPEGIPVLPREPLLTVSGPLEQVQLLETIILNLINYQSLIATKAHRITSAAQGRAVMEFGSRRAQGPSAAVLGARAAIIGGCSSTSNVLAAKQYGLPISGTMAHSWIQAFPDELTAFKKWAEIYPDNCLLLIDTYDVLSSGLPHAIQVFKQLAADGHQPIGVRIDSGDIAALAREVRQVLDQAGLHKVKITASSALDEHIIRDMINDDVPLDSFGVGEKLITSATSPVLSGVFKLSAIRRHGEVIPKIKISGTASKVTLPGEKLPYRLYDRVTQQMVGDLIALKHEQVMDTIIGQRINGKVQSQEETLTHFIAIPLQQQVFNQGQVVYESPDVLHIQQVKNKNVTAITQTLAERTDYPVYISKALAQLQAELLNHNES